GAPCSNNGQCHSKHCVDKVCCDEACQGQCQACNTMSAPGRCVAVAGTPVGARTPCSKRMAGDPCDDAICDGSNGLSCAARVGHETMCLAPSCTDAVVSGGASCDGHGHCGAPEATARCSPYACDGAACAKTCTSNAQCADFFRCETATKVCVPISTSTCISK